MDFFVGARVADGYSQIVLFLFLTGGAFLHIGLKKFLRSRQTEDLAITNIASSPQGWVAVEGQAWPTVERKGIDGRSVCYWKIDIQQFASERKSNNWKTVCSFSSNDEYIVMDQSGACLVDPRSAELYLTKVKISRNKLTQEQKDRIIATIPKAEEYLNIKKDIWYYLIGRSVRVFEWKILAGSTVYVSGDMSTTSVQAPAIAIGDITSYSEHLPKINSSSYQLKMFDTNRDGKISETELLNGSAGIASIYLRKGGQQSLTVVGKIKGTVSHALIVGDQKRDKLAKRVYLLSLFNIAIGLAIVSAALKIAFT